MHNFQFEKYRSQFARLNRGWASGEAPYKPLLLLSLVQLIGDNTVKENRIGLEVIPEWVLAFKSNWDRFLDRPFQNKFVMPFNHMRSEPFWKVVAIPGQEMSIQEKGFRSFLDLERKLDHISLDPELFELLQNTVMNGLLVEVLLDTYFSEKKRDGLAKELPYYLEEFDWMVSDHEVMPIRRMSRVERERIIATRNAAFSRDVKRVYNYRCAVSGLCVQSDSGNNYLIEACHIKPFSDSLTESISNGITLTSTLHDAFDAGFIGIDTNYKVIVSTRFRESDSPYNLKPFAGREILLPAERRFFPSQESLQWHRDVRFDKFK